jgi:hypothetical protein
MQSREAWGKLIVKLNQKREEIATRYDEFDAHLEHFPLLIAERVWLRREEMAIFRCHKFSNFNFSPSFRPRRASEINFNFLNNTVEMAAEKWFAPNGNFTFK